MARATSQPDQREISALLRGAAGGDREAFDRLFPLIYDELKRVARGRRRFERPDHTLDTTALVHEAYLRLVGHTRTDWLGTDHFLAVASSAMRRILIDHAKQRRAVKRGGAAKRLSLDEAEAQESLDRRFTEEQSHELIALDEALERLAAFNPRGAAVVQYRFFGGLSLEEIGRVMSTSERTARRAWTTAKAWLRRELESKFERDSTLLGMGPQTN